VSSVRRKVLVKRPGNSDPYWEYDDECDDEEAWVDEDWVQFCGHESLHPNGRKDERWKDGKIIESRRLE